MLSESPAAFRARGARFDYLYRRTGTHSGAGATYRGRLVFVFVSGIAGLNQAVPVTLLKRLEPRQTPLAERAKRSYDPPTSGRVTQLVECWLYTPDVIGSSPVPPTPTCLTE